MCHSAKRFLLPALMFSLVSSVSVNAYDICNWWDDSDNVVMDDVLLPADVWSDPAQFQMSEWNEVDVTTNDHPFLVSGSPQFSFGASDGDNTIGFLDEAGLMSEYGLDYSSSLAWAACWSGFFSGDIEECDVMLDPTLPWSLGPDDNNWFQSTVLHELGHVRGLDHYNNYLAMQNSGTSKYLRDEVNYMDDREAIRQNANHVNETDMTMLAKWHSGSSPQWMSMSPTTVREFQTVDLDNITVENRGTNSFGSLRFGVYLSDNTNITTFDQLLNTGSWGSFGRFTFSTFDWSATIPSMNDCGTHYLGGIIDDNEVYSERFEGNNSVVFTDGVPFSGSSYVPTPIEILLALDTFEPNDSSSSATVVSLPFSNRTLNLDDDVDRDYFEVVLHEDGTLNVDATFDDFTGNIDLRVLNSGLATVASSTTTTDDESISVDLDAGTYYVKVEGVGVGACNRYELEIDFVPEPDLFLFADGFNDGTLNAWTSFKGDPKVIAPGLDGSAFKLQIPVESAATKHFVQSNHPGSMETYSATFMLDPDKVDPGNKAIDIFRVFDDASKRMIRLKLKRQSEDNYKVRLFYRDDNGAWLSLGKTSVGASGGTTLRLEFEAASGAGADDGSLRLYRNDKLKVEGIKLDTDQQRVGLIRMGMPAGGADVIGPGGVMYFDEFTSNPVEP